MSRVDKIGDVYVVVNDTDLYPVGRNQEGIRENKPFVAEGDILIIIDITPEDNYWKETTFLLPTGKLGVCGSAIKVPSIEDSEWRVFLKRADARDQ